MRFNKDVFFSSWIRQFGLGPPPGNPANIAFWFVLALVSVGHWSTYVFAFQFLWMSTIEFVGRLAKDWYAKRWCAEQPEVQSPVPPRLSDSELMARWGEMHGEMQTAVVVLGSLQLFFQCVDRGWIEEAAYVHWHWIEPWWGREGGVAAVVAR